MGCAALFDFHELADSSSSDAGAESVAEFFVSPAGNDGADGSQQMPFRSVGAAVARATAALANGRQRIAVCAGDYSERAMPVRGAIEIHGSYDCASGTRRSFDDTRTGPSYEPSTRITSAEPGDALFVTGDDPTGSPTFSGVSIEATQNVNVILVEGATRLSHVFIKNTSPPVRESKYTTAGVLAAGTGSRIENCGIIAAPNPAAEGVAISEQNAYAVGFASGEHVVRNNVLRVQGGRGASAALTVSNSTGLELDSNELQLLSNVNEGADLLSSVGVIASESVVKSTRNIIALDSPGNLRGITRVQGILVSSGSFESDGDRVLGPRTIHESSSRNVIRLIGFHGDHGLRRVTNASVFWALDSSVRMGDSSAIRIAPNGQGALRPTDLMVAHNSVYISGTREDEDVTAVRAFALSDDALETALPNAVTFASNLVLFDLDKGALVRGQCARPDYARIASNRYGGG